MDKGSIIAPMEISLTVKSMKHQFIQYLQDYEGRIQKAIQEVSTQYLDNFDFESSVKQELSLVLHTYIKNKIDYHLWNEIQNIIDLKTKEAVALCLNKPVESSPAHTQDTNPPDKDAGR